jgi:nicotinamidase-related amidase
MKKESIRKDMTMIARRYEYNQILVDVDTQRDLFLAKGAASVFNHKRLLANIRRVMAAARHDHIQTISTAQFYDEHHHNPGFCLAGTEGFKKLRYTVRDRYHYYLASDSTDLPRDLLSRYHQVIFYKRGVDPFKEPRIDRMLTELSAREIILIGATAEGAVRATALGLLKRGKRVRVFTDAVGMRDRSRGQRALREMESRGAILSKTSEILGCSKLKIVHACTCKRCRAKDLCSDH